jgi:hypothetical protein
MDFLGIESRSTYYKYLQEIVDNAIVIKSKSSSYWINPTLVFNGNRIDYYKEHCPECISEINITSIQENRLIKKKKELIKLFNVKDYYQLKKLVGKEQIDAILSGKLDPEKAVLTIKQLHK